MGYLTCAKLINMKKKEIKKIARTIYDIRIEKNCHDMYLYICDCPLDDGGNPTSDDDKYNKKTIKHWMNDGLRVRLSSDEIHKEMCYLSEKIPDLLISMHGEGEFNDDIWKSYYMNGKYQECRAKIVFDDYDVDKLELLE